VRGALARPSTVQSPSDVDAGSGRCLVGSSGSSSIVPGSFMLPAASQSQQTSVADADAQTAVGAGESMPELTPALRNTTTGFLSPVRTSTRATTASGGHEPVASSTRAATANVGARRTTQAKSAPARRPATNSQSNASALQGPSTPSPESRIASRRSGRDSQYNEASGTQASRPRLLGDRPRTQADRPRTQASVSQSRSSTEWRGMFGGNFGLSIPEASESSGRASTTSTRRSRQALFSQAARFTFPGRRSVAS
jgi:hypothetical protein